MAINVKRILADALIELSTEKPLRKITITELVERAGTGRQTFYNHFKDKNDLIYWIYSRTIAGERKLVETQGHFAYMVKLHQEAQKLCPFLMQACKLTGQNSLSEVLYQQNYNYYQNYVIRCYGEEKLTEDLEYALRFNAAGASYVYMGWVLSGAPGPAERQAELTLSCMPQCIRSLLPLHMEETPEGP